VHTLIATFYAYKGGTGRTLTLSNVARFLADELGYRVGLVDLDIESPGLVHEPLCAELEREDGVRESIRDAIDKKKGFVECFLESANSKDPLAHINQIDEHVYALSSGRNGGILLMPAAAGSVYTQGTYNDAVNQFMVTLSIMAEEVSDAGGISLASKITFKILTDFAKRYQLDFLFIDGRTGTGPFFPVYVYSVPHLLVLFTGLNDQNVLGNLSVLRATTDGDEGPVPVFLVASPVPTVGPAEFEGRLAFIAKKLNDERRERNPATKYLYQLPQNVDFFLPYSDAASFGEAYFHGCYPHSNLADAHRKLAISVANLVVRRREPTLPIAVSAVAERVTVALENVHADLEIIKSDAFEVHLDSFRAEDPHAPWYQLFEAKNPRPLDEMPDVIVIPQTRLQALATKSDKAPIYDLNGLRDRVGEKSLRALDFEFLDSYYPNWRRWCTSSQSLAGLPFSVNAMLLCANAEKLDPICSLYWNERHQHPANTFFLPSNWHTLIDLLRLGIEAGYPNEIFRIVRDGPGLYYDWLNLTASLGGFDLIQSEGRLLQEIALDSPETVEATQLFVELARMSGESPTMEDQIVAFARGRIAMYVGWTDSFRFDLTKGASSGVYVTPLRETKKARESDQYQDIRLGYCPRDMRHSRKSLVDGWLMVFPKKKDERHPNRALAFADAFLDPSNQRRLLQQGFPSPSAWAIEKEIEVLKTDRTAAPAGRDSGTVPKDGRKLTRQQRAQQSFEVFLDTMKSAIHSGRWIASPKIRAEESIARKLRDLIDGKNKNVRHELEVLAKDLRAKLGLSPMKG
jgi:ABC-type glycerol-3-phosphate transport system substrate-binding protein